MVSGFVFQNYKQIGCVKEITINFSKSDTTKNPGQNARG
jgi:hypothetical protein